MSSRAHHHIDRVPLDDKAKEKIVALRRDHGMALKDIAERYGCGIARVKEVLAEAGLIQKRLVSGDVLERAFDFLEQAAISGERCPMNDQMPGGGKSLSVLARQGKIFVEVYVHNFRRVTILTGEHKDKTTANPPKYAGKPPKPYLTVGLVKRRNGAVIPTCLDARLS